MSSLGRKLFPGDAPWQRRKKVRVLVLAVLAGMVFGAAVMVVFLLQKDRP